MVHIYIQWCKCMPLMFFILKKNYSTVWIVYDVFLNHQLTVQYRSIRITREFSSLDCRCQYSTKNNYQVPVWWHFVLINLNSIDADDLLKEGEDLNNSEPFPNNDLYFTEDEFIESINNTNDATRRRDSYDFTWGKIKDHFSS